MEPTSEEILKQRTVDILLGFSSFVFGEIYEETYVFNLEEINSP